MSLECNNGDIQTNGILLLNAGCLLSSSLFSKGFTSGAKLAWIAHSPGEEWMLGQLEQKHGSCHI